MITVPTWAAIAVSIGTPALTFIGVLIAQKVTRVGAKELEARSKREEVMRNLRWAAELAVSDDEARATMGVNQLNSLSQSNMNDPDVQALVDSALNAVVQDVADEVEEAGDDADIEVEDGSDNAEADPPVPSNTSTGEEGGHR